MPFPEYLYNIKEKRSLAVRSTMLLVKSAGLTVQSTMLHVKSAGLAVRSTILRVASGDLGVKSAEQADVFPREEAEKL